MLSIGCCNDRALRPCPSSALSLLREHSSRSSFSVRFSSVLPLCFFSPSSPLSCCSCCGCCSYCCSCRSPAMLVPPAASGSISFGSRLAEMGRCCCGCTGCTFFCLCLIFRCADEFRVSTTITRALCLASMTTLPFRATQTPSPYTSRNTNIFSSPSTL